MLVATERRATETRIHYKYKFLGVAFTSDGWQNEELYIRIGKAIVIMRTLHDSAVVRWELSKKKQNSHFSKQSLSLFTNCISIWLWKFGNDWKGAISSAIVQNEVSPKNWRSYIIDNVRISWDSKFSKAATSPNWKISAKMVWPRKQKTSGTTFKQALLAKANGKKTVGRPRTTVDESILH